MKKYFFILILLTFTHNIHSSTQLPWDSLFNTYCLSDKMKLIPMHISHKLDVKYSKGDRVGLWGLTTPVARHYGLQVNNEIDERYDIRLASEVAAHYLKDLIQYWGNENLAQLAYLNGAALMIEMATIHNINLHNITNEDLNLLCQKLPTNNICNSITITNTNYLDSLYHHTGYTKHKLNHPIRKQTLQDSIFGNLEKFELHNLSILSETKWIDEVFIPENIDIEKLIANISDTEHKALEIAKKEIEIQRLSQEEYRKTTIKKANAVTIYHVKSGDTLGHIAKRHKVSIRQLKQWNNLKSDIIRIGQKLKIHTN